jgi:hypothetical protein
MSEVMQYSPEFQRIVVGYHGCDQEIGIAVLLGEKSIKKSNNKYDWLGEGIYFWEYSPQRALEFANEQKSRNKVKIPFVLGAYIHLGRCFDSTDTRYTGQLTEAFNAWERFLKAENMPMPENKKGSTGGEDLVLRYRDCALLNWYMRIMDEKSKGCYYQTVRGVFVEGGPVYSGSKFYTKTHIQIAVRDRMSLN